LRISPAPFINPVVFANTGAAEITVAPNTPSRLRRESTFVFLEKKSDFNLNNSALLLKY